MDSSRPEQRILEQSMRLSERGAVTAWGSLRMHGGAYFDGLARGGQTQRPVPLLSPDRQLRSVSGSTMSQESFDPDERIVAQGVPCSEVRRATFDEMRHDDLRHAVEVVDMAAAAALTSIGRMTAYVAGRGGWAGIPLVPDALALADEHSASPPETRMRLVWILDAELPRPLCNRPVFSTSVMFLGIPDLLDVEAGVVGEYDGADHLQVGRRQHDLRREEPFRQHGLEYFTVLSPDLHDLDRLVERMRNTRALAAAPLRPREWTLTAPAEWSAGVQSLDERLEFRDFLAEMAGLEI